MSVILLLVFQHADIGLYRVIILRERKLLCRRQQIVFVHYRIALLRGIRQNVGDAAVQNNVSLRLSPRIGIEADHPYIREQQLIFLGDGIRCRIGNLPFVVFRTADDIRHVFIGGVIAGMPQIELKRNIPPFLPRQIIFREKQGAAFIALIQKAAGIQLGHRLFHGAKHRLIVPQKENIERMPEYVASIPLQHHIVADFSHVSGLWVHGEVFNGSPEVANDANQPGGGVIRQ
ncbi:hypothetical protein SDC9_116991 [bioreactor metagenome]|uniref:Uncharacterized protein n=1 Tax=bioreactor metagenome TaxID=1076179 RepID=A0A645BX38_9ZZZZ